MLKRALKFTLILLLVLVKTAIYGQKEDQPVFQLIPLTEQLVDYKQTQDEITLRVKRLTYEDTYKVFGDRVKKIFNSKNPITPIQFSITNCSDKNWLIADKNIDLKLEMIKNVKSRLCYMSSSSRQQFF